MTSEAEKKIQERIDSLNDRASKVRRQYQSLALVTRAYGLEDALKILRGEDPDAEVEDSPDSGGTE